MAEYSRDANLGAGALPLLEEATPPLAPAPMPRQTLVFWTPRLALGSILRGMTEIGRPLRIMQRATISVPNSDEPR